MLTRTAVGVALALVACGPEPPAHTESPFSVHEACRAVFAFAIARYERPPLLLHSRDPQCRSAIADLETEPEVRPARAEGRRRRCPGPHCGPRSGTLVIVEPIGETPCFHVWSYRGTGGAHEQACLESGQVRPLGLPTVY